MAPTPQDDSDAVIEGRQPPPRTGRRIGCGLTFLFFLAASYGFRSPVHYSDPIQLKVIDEETGKPLPGVVAVALWQLDTIDLPLDIYKTEAVSDSGGNLHLAGMPLRIRPPLSWFKYWDPVIHIYKPGYRKDFLHNAMLAESVRGAYDTLAVKRRCFWNGQTIPLERDKTPEQYLDSFTSANYQRQRFVPPIRYPKFWHALVLGYQGLSPEQKEHADDPQPIIDYWKTKEGR